MELRCPDGVEDCRGMTHAAYRARLALDAGALGDRDALDQLDDARTLAQLDAIDARLQRAAARRSVWLPSAAQLAALEAEVAEWVCDCSPELGDELEELLQLAPVVRTERGAIQVREGQTLRGPDYRTALEELRAEARTASCVSMEAGWVGPFAQPSDIAQMLEGTDAEVRALSQEVDARQATATAPAQREAIADWRAWEEAWSEWYAADPSTWWGGTITELDAWQAQLRDHRAHLEAALAGALATPHAERERDPVTRVAEQAAEVVGNAGGGLGLGLGLAVGAGLLLYAAATGKLGGRSRG